MEKITSLSLIEAMDRELNSIESDLIEANKIEDMDQRQEALQELFNERDNVINFFQEEIDKLIKLECMSITEDGQLTLLSH